MPFFSTLRRTVGVACVAAAVFAATPAAAHAISVFTPATIGLTGYDANPVWNDEFNSASLDKSRWYAEDIAWPHNSEMQYYSPAEKYVSTSFGDLVITATPDKTGGRNYTSARISTEKSMLFKHGLFAARIKMTEGQGIWPAWWMFGTGDIYSEIDIAEQAGGNSADTGKGYGDDRTVQTLVHFGTEPHGQYVTRGPTVGHKLTDGAKFSGDYHVFWLEWTEHEVRCGVDDDDNTLLVADISQLPAFQASMYMIFNLAVGGNYPGAPDSTTNFPQSMMVDWVRVWAKNGEKILTDLATTPDQTPPASSGEGGANGGGAGSTATTTPAPTTTGGAATNSGSSNGATEGAGNTVASAAASAFASPLLLAASVLTTVFAALQ